MTLVDSHCHLDDEKFAADRDAVIERAQEAGVARMLAVGTGSGPPDLDVAIRLAQQYSCIRATVGVHPHDASKVEDGTFDELRARLRLPEVIAIGEIGLDYHYNFSPPEQQREVFVEQLRIAAQFRKPVIIHTREAWDDTMELLARHWAPGGLGGIMHCFSGGPDEARAVLAMNFSVSFAGIVTFPKATAIHEAAKVTPLDRLLVETDAPYLAPSPHRGKRNEPAFVVHTARRLAELRGESLEEIARATTANFDRLFVH
jgi:TatD DNase family protein